MSQRQTKSPWYVYGDVDFPLDMGGGGDNALIEITLELMKR